jgi:hypothetical protein
MPVALLLRRCQACSALPPGGSSASPSRILDTMAPANPEERLVFTPAMEALFVRALGRMVTPDLVSSLRELGIDLEKPLLPAYPFSQWVRALELSAAAL